MTSPPGSQAPCAVVLLAAATLGLLVSCSSRALAKGQSNGILRGGLELAGTGIRSTALAAIRQPLTTARVAAGMAIDRTEELVRGNIPFPLTARPRTTGTPGSPVFSQSLTRLGLPAPSLGTVDLMVGGEEFFRGLDEEIRQATEFIDIQIYIWDIDDIGVRFADLVRQRGREIPVRVIIDDLGSTGAAAIAPRTPPPPGFPPPSNMLRYLRTNSSLQARRTLNPLLILDHTKLLVFDGKTATIGGMNIGREYRTEWHDLMVRLRGPIVRQLHPEFQKKWRASGFFGDFALPWTRKKPERIGRLHPPPSGAYPVRPLRTNSIDGRHEILDVTLEAIRASRTRVWIENPYVSSDRIVDALLDARRRGVDVRVIIPDRTHFMDIANLSTARSLIRAGALVYHFPGMTHLKAMICDGWATVGAANLDTNSLQINDELNISFWDRRAVGTLAERVFHKDFARSRILAIEDTANLLAPLLEPLADQL